MALEPVVTSGRVPAVTPGVDAGLEAELARVGR
jgi:hypothetical protein